MIKYQSQCVYLDVHAGGIKAYFKNQSPFYCLDIPISAPMQLAQVLPQAWQGISKQQDCNYDHAAFGLALGEFWQMDSEGIVAVRSSNVTELDVYRAIDAAKNIFLNKQDCQLSWTLQGFTVDDVAYAHPVGQQGNVLKAKLSHQLTKNDYPQVLQQFCQEQKINFMGASQKCQLL